MTLTSQTICRGMLKPRPISLVNHQSLKKKKKKNEGKKGKRNEPKSKSPYPFASTLRAVV